MYGMISLVDIYIIQIGNLIIVLKSKRNNKTYAIHTGFLHNHLHKYTCTIIDRR